MLMETRQDDTEDAAIIRRVRAGEEAAFGALVERYFPLVYAIASAHLGRRDAAEDLTQEVFLRALLNLERLRDPRTFPGWLVRIARNLASTWRRDGRRASRLLPLVPLEEMVMEIPDSRQPSAREQLAEKEEHRLLREAILRLPAELSEVMLLHFAEEMSPAEIARLLGVHRSSVGRMIERGVAALRIDVEENVKEAVRPLRTEQPAVARASAVLVAAAALSASGKATLAAAAGATVAPPVGGVIGTLLGGLKSGASLLGAKGMGAGGAVVIGAAALTAVQMTGGGAGGPAGAGSGAGAQGSAVVAASGSRSTAPERAGSSLNGQDRSLVSAVGTASGVPPGGVRIVPPPLAASGGADTSGTSASLSALAPASSRVAGRVVLTDAQVTQQTLIVEGRLTDAMGRAVTTATVSLWKMKWNAEPPVGSTVYGQELTAETGSRPDGWYSLVVPDERVYFLKISCPGFGTVAYKVQNAFGNHLDLRARRLRREIRHATLLPAVPMRGEVRDEEAKPISEALVHVSMVEGEEGAAFDLTTATTNASGAYEIADLAAGPVALSFVAEGREPVSVVSSAPKIGDLTVMPTATGSIEGTIYHLATRQGAAGATVTLQADLEHRSWPWGQRRFASRVLPVDATGSFSVGPLPSGRYHLRAQLGQKQVFVGNGKSSLVRLVDGETTSGVSLFLYDGHTIRGTVRDQGSRAPLEGAVVQLEPMMGDPLQKTVSNARGEYALSGVFPQREQMFLHARKPGYGHDVPNSQQLWMQDHVVDRITLPDHAVVLDHDVEMVAGRVVAGRVLDEEGTPLAGATVTLCTQYGRFWDRPVRTTASDGRFEFPVAPEASGYVKAVAPSAPPVFSEPFSMRSGQASGLELRLERSVAVSGQVIDPEQRPAAGVLVSVCRRIPLDHGSMPEPIGEAVTDTQGNFSFAKLPPKRLEFLAEGNGFAPSERTPVQLGANVSSTSVVLSLRTPHFIGGRVTLGDGKPLPGVMVQATTRDNLIERGSYTDDLGRYRISELPEGQFHVSASKSSLVPTMDQRLPVHVDRDDVDFVFGGAPGTSGTVTVRGKLVDWQTSQPVRNFTVSLQMQGETSDVGTTEPGTFLIHQVTPTNMGRFLAEAPGYVGADSGSFSIPKGADPFEKVVRMGPGGTIIGRVIEGVSRAPIPGARVHLKGIGHDQTLHDSPALQTVTTDREGRFQLTRVKEGGNLFEIETKETSITVSRRAVVRHGEIADAGDIVVGKGGHLVGRVIKVPGLEPVAGTLVKTVLSGTIKSAAESKTDANGEFEVRGVFHGFDLLLPEYGLKAHKWINPTATRPSTVTIRVGTGRIRGRVIMAGKPVEASVMLKSPDLQVELQGFTGAEGTFEYENLMPGTWTIDAYGQNQSASTTVKVEPEAAAEVTLEFNAGTLVARVVDAEGKGVEGAELHLRRVGGRGDAGGRSKAEGRFEWPSLKPGEFFISAQRSNPSEIAVPVRVTVPPLAASSEALLVLRAGGGTLRIQVSTAENQPLAGAWCQFHTDQGEFHGNVTSDRQGVMTRTTIPEGKYSVVVGAKDRVSTRHEVEIQEGGTAELSTVLHLGGMLTWIVTDTCGEPVGGARCTLTRLEEPSAEAQAQTGETAGDGRWNAAELLPGRWRGVVTNAKGQSVTEEFTVKVGEYTYVESDLPGCGGE